MIVIVGNVFLDIYEEIVCVIELGVEVICYYDFIVCFIELYISIVVIGLYGKISMIGLLVYVLSGINLISYLIGDGIGYGELDVDFFVFEVCEYCCYFLVYLLDYVIMMNIDFDYLDYYKSIEDVFLVF